LELVRLKLHQVLHEAVEVIKSTYFMETGLASVLAVQPDEKSVEVGLIGKEGFVGLPAIFGLKASALRVVVLGDGTSTGDGNPSQASVTVRKVAAAASVFFDDFRDAIDPASGLQSTS
jgi:CRP-like cAMP-binding protein